MLNLWVAIYCVGECPFRVKCQNATNSSVSAYKKLCVKKKRDKTKIKCKTNVALYYKSFYVKICFTN